MKELFRERDVAVVGYYQSIVEGEGIPTEIRNEHLTGLTEFPIPDFYPTLFVINDEDYEPALNAIRRRNEENEKNADQETVCAKCSEVNPGNFEICWSCGENITPDSDD